MTDYLDDDENLLENALLLFDGNRGVYVPQHFAEEMNREFISGVTSEQWAILESGPDHEWYWEAWDEVTNNAVLHDPDHDDMYLWQDGDLWAVPLESS